jgi:hypothetical protein
MRHSLPRNHQGTWTASHQLLVAWANGCGSALHRLILVKTLFDGRQDKQAPQVRQDEVTTAPSFTIREVPLQNDDGIIPNAVPDMDIIRLLVTILGLQVSLNWSVEKRQRQEVVT